MLNPRIDHYLSVGCGRCPLGNTPDCKVHRWTAELRELRRMLLEIGLTEELKWSAPCYTYDQRNILMLSALKDCCVIGFFKGSLLRDEHQILHQPGANSQAARTLRITSIEQIGQQETIIKAYVQEAIELEKSGVQVTLKRTEDYELPTELQQAFVNNPAFKMAFEALTPGRQRGYILYFSAPKQSQTRVSRIEKCTADIVAGRGLHDR